MELGRPLGYSLTYTNVGDVMRESISNPIFLELCDSAHSWIRKAINDRMRFQIVMAVSSVYNIVVEDSSW